MPDLGIGEILILLAGVVLVVAGLFGLVPLLLDARSSAGAGRRRKGRSEWLAALTALPAATEAESSVSPETPAAASSDVGLMEEMLAQMLCLRDEIGAVAAEVRSLRQDLAVKRKGSSRKAAALDEIVIKETKSGRKAA